MKRYPFGNHLLYIPDDHKIGAIHGSHPLYDRAYGFIVAEIAKRSPQGAIVDIGANIGDTAAYIASHVSNPILSVEGSDDFLAYLRANRKFLPPQVTILERFVLPERLRASDLRFSNLEGTGSLVGSYGTGTAVAEERFIDIPALLAQARQLSADQSLALVKTDTDGMDADIVDEVLRIEDVPVFFECDPTMTPPQLQTAWPGVFEALTDRRYRIVVFDNFGRPMLCEGAHAGATLRDLCGYVSFQRSVHPVTLHYLDVWAFPESWNDVHANVSALLRAEHLKPNGF